MSGKLPRFPNDRPAPEEPLRQADRYGSSVTRPAKPKALPRRFPKTMRFEKGPKPPKWA